MNEDAITFSSGPTAPPVLTAPARRIPLIGGPYPWVGLAACLYGTLVAVIVAFVLYPSQHLVANTIDLNGFGALARNIAEGHGFTWGFGPTMRRAPLYPFIGAALMKVFGPNTLSLPDPIAYRPILVANCVFFGLTCLTAWAIARRLFGARIALWVAVLCPLVPQSVRYVGMTEVETIMGLFVALLVWTSLSLIERPGFRIGAAFGLIAAAAALTKPVIEYYPLLFVALAWIYWWTTQKPETRAIPTLVTRPRVLASVAMVTFFVLPLVPWTVRNSAVSNGQFTGISTDGAGSFLRGYVNTKPKYYLLYEGFDNGGAWENEANATEEAVLRPYGITFYHVSFDPRGKAVVSPAVPKAVTFAHVEAQKERVEGAAMKNRLLHQPGAFLKKFLIQIAVFWYLETSRLSSLAVGGISLIVLVFAALGIVSARRHHIVTWPIVAIVLYMNAVYAFSLALGRYSAPLFSTLMVLSVAGLVWLISHLIGNPSPDRADAIARMASRSKQTV